MIFEFIQKISFIICEKNRILHTFVIEPYRNQKRIPQKVKNAVVTDCHEKSGKILILIGIEQSRRKTVPGMSVPAPSLSSADGITSKKVFLTARRHLDL